MNRLPRNHVVTLLIVTVCLLLSGAGKAKQKSRPQGKQSTEAVWVINAIDNTGRYAFVVRSEGKAYKVKKGGGCANIRAYDSQKIPAVSSGSFLAPGSYFDILQEGEKCMVDEALELKKGDLHAVSTELDERKTALVKKVQEALAMAGKFGGEPEGKLDAPTVAAFKQFQKASGLKPTGDVSAEMLLALMAFAQKKDNLELLTTVSKILWPYAQAI